MTPPWPEACDGPRIPAAQGGAAGILPTRGGAPRVPHAGGGVARGADGQYERFGLVLMLTHACNMRCTYCYGGEKSNRRMAPAYGRAGIDRAIASLTPGGTLELGFFGGEPLLEAKLALGLTAYARRRAARRGVTVEVGVTTNGTVAGPAAWRLLTDPEVDVAVSHDGLPAVHDAHRVTADGRGTSEAVRATLRRLRAAGKSFSVVMVVRPDTVGHLSSGVEYHRCIGIRHMEPSLDLWTVWTADDLARLAREIHKCALLWRDALPDFSLSWFDEKAALLACLPQAPTARCGFGAGQMAVAPSGRLYPCERLISSDAANNAARLPGHVADGGDFLSVPAAPCRSAPACSRCSVADLCNTTCRCSNYVRTGDPTQPDRLLCALNRMCLDETANVLTEVAEACPA